MICPLHQDCAQGAATALTNREGKDICYTAPEFAMIDPKSFEQVFDSLRQALPGGFAQDVEKNLRAALSAALARLDLVTREEFDVQAQVLARTRERLEALAKQLVELEQRLAGK